MSKVHSSDGTPIAFERAGEGPPLILVGGAFNDRNSPAAGAALAGLLAPDFTVFTYDRRGRGESGDTTPYAVDREVEDLQALIDEAGGSAFVYGLSSGAVLALEAAVRAVAITRLALYEPPIMVHGSVPEPQEHVARLSELITAGQRGDAVEYFMTQVVGMPSEVVVPMRNAPFWQGLERMAHTLVYDMTITRDGSRSIERLSSITVPTLVIGGEESPSELRQAVQIVARTLLNGEAYTMTGQTHDVSPEVLAPVLKEYFVSD